MVNQKEHIGTRMIAFIKAKGHVLSKWEEDQRQAGKGFSVGYLAKAAKNNITIGLDLVEEFLTIFPEVDPHWLITGRALRTNTDKKLTDGITDGNKEKEEVYGDDFVEAQMSYIEHLQNEIRNLRKSKRDKEGGKASISDN